MSAIHSVTTNTNGITYKYHTKLKVIAHSNSRQDPIDLSDDIKGIIVGKNIKGTGQANISLTPALNYLNHLGPNDYLNVYVDRSDGYGWTRLFFGLIDRIEESYSVSDKGAPITTYSLLCSDFAKIFDKSQYYNNPAIVGRDDVFTREIGNPFASIALYSNGLLIQGCPSDVVTQIAIALVGFSGQFTLPDSYATAVKNSSIIGENRIQRLNLAQSLMSPQSVAGLPTGGLFGIAQEANRLSDTGVALDQFTQGSTGLVDLERLAESMGVDVAHLPDHIHNNPQAVRDFVSTRYVTNSLTSLPGFTNETSLFGSVDRSIINIVTSVVPGTPRNILGLINVGTFVERRAIDGFMHGGALPNNDSPIIALLRSYANEIVNELFFDLRPLSADNSGLAIGTNWATDPDEISGNDGGIRYVPAMIMREYPFSTIDKISGRNVEYHLNTRTGQTATYGDFNFGAIFSNNPNVPGRHIISMPSINLQDRITKGQEALNDVARKHIDVATIHSSEIFRSTFSRSDTDIVNLIEITTEGILGQAANQYMVNLLPIVTPISIKRHGLRVKTDSTRYARPNLSLSQARGDGPVADSVQEQGGTPPEAPSGTPGALSAPMLVTDEYFSDRNFVTGGDNSLWRWGFVRDNQPSVGRVRIHHGIDVYAQPGTPVYSIMDGIVERVEPNGDGRNNNTYGNTIVIRHPGAGLDGQDVWSVYAHLGVPKYIPRPNMSGSSDTVGKLNPLYDESDPVKSSGMIVTVGQSVNAGQHIGYCGWTAGNRNSNIAWHKYCGLQRDRAGGNSHLHFEIIKNRNGKHFPAVNATEPDSYPISQKSGLPPFSEDPAIMATISSVDPVKFFDQKSGLDFRDMVDARGGSPDTPSDVEDESDDQPTTDDNPTPPPERDADTTQDVASEPDPGPGIGIDSGTVQNIIGRWALLTDHWYQHNAEYLSGTIDMRGAPEIRVGYRLDIVDRNLSFYVEGVTHKWQFPDAMSTSLTVTRGQPNNPYPAYILPRTTGFGAGASQRDSGSRLGKFFLSPDPASVRRSMVIRKNSGIGVSRPVFSEDTNSIDTASVLGGNPSETYKASVMDNAPVGIDVIGEGADLRGSVERSIDDELGFTQLAARGLLDPLPSLDDQVPTISGINPGGSTR